MRFYIVFLPAFLAYAVLWGMAYLALKSRAGEWTGAAVGCIAFIWISMKMLHSTRGWLLAALALFVLHTSGYFASEKLI